MAVEDAEKKIAMPELAVEAASKDLQDARERILLRYVPTDISFWALFVFVLYYFILQLYQIFIYVYIFRSPLLNLQR